MRIGRTIPPAAAPLTWIDAGRGIAGAIGGRRAVLALEEDFRRAFGMRHVFSLSSGTAALTVTLAALKSLSSRRDVVIPAFTCFSVAAAVVHAGLRPTVISAIERVNAAASEARPAPTYPTTAGAAAMAKPPSPMVSTMAESPMSGLASAAEKPAK